MITIGKNSNKVAYGIKHYNLDTENDLANLPTLSPAIGSTCFVISTSKHYMLNSDRQWIEINPFGSLSSSENEIIYDGGSVSEESTDEEETPSTEDVIYEGGVV